MAYGGDPAEGQIDAVRFWLQDTAPAPLLSDAELRYFIDYSSDYTTDALLLAASLCTVIAAKYAGEGQISGDGVDYSFAQVQDKYVALGQQLRTQYQLLNANRGRPYDGSADAFARRHPGGIPPLFTVGQFDNPRGASQVFQYPATVDDGEIYPGGSG